MSGSAGLKRRKGKGRAQAPTQIDLSTPESSREPSPGASATTVPLLSRSVSFKTPKAGDGRDETEQEIDPRVKISRDGRMKITAPGTPWDEVNLSDSFLAAIHEPATVKHFWSRRRFVFLIGGLLGILSTWLLSEGDPLKSLSGMDVDSYDVKSLFTDLPSLTMAGLNLTDVLAPGREWLSSKANNFEVGRSVKSRGQEKKHAVVIIPGIISSGLESWSTTEETSAFFRKRIWASTFMLRALAMNKDGWVKAMSLDPVTGLDPPGGLRVRAAQGLDAASAFLPGYWIWQKVIENLAVLGYDHNDLTLAAYDWRLSYYNLEVRDRYFSRLQTAIEINLRINGKKTVLASHSMGGAVVLWFMKWVEAESGGNGGTDWCERHIADWVNIAGTMLGVPKAMSALLSGEMRDVVELNAAAVYLIEKFFSRSERAKLFRSWAGSASMMPKGGDAVWGDGSGSPDEPENSTWRGGGHIYLFKTEEAMNSSEVTSTSVPTNLTLDDGITYLLEHSSDDYQRMMANNFSLGFERDPVKIAENDHLHQKWTNPLETRLPNAPSMRIYCLYGHGKETERAYFYQDGGFEHDELNNAAVNATCEDGDCDATERNSLDFPLTRKSWVDTSVTMDQAKPAVRSGVVFGEGDGTVSLLSLGAMCTHGWKMPIYNPAGIDVITHEIKHEPMAFDPRGGPTTADHVDILGSSELNEALLDVATGHGHRVKDKFVSRIREYASRIRWEK